MAEKKIAKKSKLSKLNEDALQEQPVTPIAQPVPATDAEVAQAAEPAVAEPAVPVENTELPVENPTDTTDPMFTPPAEGYVPAGWVKIEDLASAVAQATGDVVPAETAPDTQAVATDENVEPAAPAVGEEQPLVQEPAQPVVESKRSSKKRVREGFLSKVIDGAKVKSFEALGGREALAREIEDYKNHPEKYAHSPLKGMVDALLIQRGYMDEDHNWIETDFEDDDAYYIDEDDYDALEDDYEEDDYEDDYEDFDESKKSSKKRVREADSTLGMSMKDGIEAMLKKLEAEPLHEAEENDDLHDPEEDIEDTDLDFEDEDAEDADSDEDEDIEDADSEGDTSEGEITGEVNDFLSSLKNKAQEADEDAEDTEKDIRAAADSLEKGSSFLRGLLDDEGDYGIDVSGLNFKSAEEDDESEELEESEGVEVSEDGELDECIERVPVKFKPAGIKTQEVPKRPSLRARESYTGFLPAGSEHFAGDSNLVESYAKSAAAKRRAIANFREAMKARQQNVTSDRFREALRSSSKLTETTIDPKSWSANRFQEKVEERKQLNFKELLAKGYLG